MHLEQFLQQILVYLAAAVISVPLAKRLGLGSALGYLIAGIIIGPFVLGLIGDDSANIMHFAEFGVVMMLFIIGLELQPALLWRRRLSILGLGGLQVIVTSIVIAAIAISLGQFWQTALAIGMILSLSSTAIVLQTLSEKDMLATSAGRSSFSVLLFQDMAVIPMLALLPLLAIAAPEMATSPQVAETHGLAALPGWQKGLAVLAAVGAIILAGRFIMTPILRFIASAHLPEIFTAAALGLVVGIAVLMLFVGLSPALGTFLAGVVLADSEYRHEIELDLAPFKGLLLGLFFISVGASLDFGLISRSPLMIAGIVFGLVAIKILVGFGLGKLFKMTTRNCMFFAFALAQGSEFAFVLFSFAISNNIMPADIANPLIAAVALSMALTPILMILNDVVLTKYFAEKIPPVEHDDIDQGSDQAVIAGFGRFGMMAGRLLSSNGINITVLDHDPAQIEVLRRFGVKVFYGDAMRPDLLKAAGCDSAKILLIAIDERKNIDRLVTIAKKHFPDIKILARAKDRGHVYELRELGADVVVRETFGSAMDIGAAALKELGFSAYRAHRAARQFKHHDEHNMSELAPLWRDRKEYIVESRKRAEDIERLFQSDPLEQATEDMEEAWHAPPVVKPRKKVAKPRKQKNK